MSSLFGDGGPLEGLLEFLRSSKKSCFDCNNAKEIKIADLDANELEEWNSMAAIGNDLRKRLKRLLADKEVLKARRKIFWTKLEIKYDTDSEDKLRISDDTKFVKLECSLDKCDKED